MKYISRVDEQEELNGELNNDDIHIRIDDEGEKLIGWASLGTVDLETAEKFAHEILRAVKIARK